MGKVQRKRWSSPEKKIVENLFGNNIDTQVLPSLKECCQAIHKNVILKERSPQMLKSFVDNQIRKKSRLSNKLN